MYREESVKAIIEKCKIKLNCGKEINVELPFIKGLKIYSSLEFPGILGEILITDYKQIPSNDLEYCGGILPGDKISFMIVSGDESEPEGKIVCEFDIYSVQSYDIKEYREHNSVRVKFCSSWLIPGFLKQIHRKYWKNKTTTQIIKDLILFCNGKIKRIEESSTRIDHFTAPIWTPISIIRFLLKKSRSKETNSSTYLLFENLDDGIYVVTKDLIVQKNEEIFGKLDEKVQIRHPSEIYKGRTNLMNFKTFADISPLYHGITKSEIQTFNFEEDTFYSIQYSPIKDVEQKHLTLSSLILDKFEDWKVIKTNFTDFTDKEKLFINQWKGPIKSEFEHKTFLIWDDTIKLVVMLPVSVKRKVGQLINVEVLRPEKNERLVDKRLSGKYFIRDLMYQYLDGYFYQILVLEQDGWFIPRPDTIKWR